MRLNLRRQRLGLGISAIKRGVGGNSVNNTLRIVVLSVPQAEFGSPWEGTWRVLGGTAPYTLTDSTMPAWVDTIGLVGDIITASASSPDDVAGSPFSYDLEVTDDVSDIATLSGTITEVAVVPDAPTDAAATAGNAEADVTFTAPAFTGGSAITGYRVTSSPGGITATGASSPITITGLTNLTAYTFTVAATNAIGYGAESTPSNEVTPSAYAPISATGGTESTIDVAGRSYRLHVFNSSADFIVSSLGTNPEEAEALLIAGGGGGGFGQGTGGGGGGGLLAGDMTVLGVTLLVSTYPIVVGAGGAGAPTNGSGSSGSSSTGLGLTAIGGGGGAGNNLVGLTGGSGGGGGTASNATFLGGAGTVGQGFAGGSASSGGSAATSPRSGGGGGGAGSVGGNGGLDIAGNGGAGITSSITGASVGYAGGGGGARQNATGTQGLATQGGGNGGYSGNGSSGAASTGGGGGGTSSASGTAGGDGGSGYFAIRYPLEAA